MASELWFAMIAPVLIAAIGVVGWFIRRLRHLEKRLARIEADEENPRLARLEDRLNLLESLELHRSNGEGSPENNHVIEENPVYPALGV